MLDSNGVFTSKNYPEISPTAKTPAVPPGFCLYASGLRVDGVRSRRAAAQNFASSSEISIELEKDFENLSSLGPIKVIGISKTKRYFIGYVPLEVSTRIAESGLTSYVRAQLQYISQGSEGEVAVFFQLILPEFFLQDGIDAKLEAKLSVLS